MKKQLFVLGMTSVFALTGCHGIKKVEYAEFKVSFLNKDTKVCESEVLFAPFDYLPEYMCKQTYIEEEDLDTFEY